jgi:beta-xylosidase
LQLKKNKKKATDDERTSSMDKMSKSEARGIEPGDYKEKFKEFAATAVEPTQVWLFFVI